MKKTLILIIFLLFIPAVAYSENLYSSYFFAEGFNDIKWSTDKKDINISWSDVTKTGTFKCYKDNFNKIWGDPDYCFRDNKFSFVLLSAKAEIDFFVKAVFMFKDVFGDNTEAISMDEHDIQLTWDMEKTNINAAYDLQES